MTHDEATARAVRYWLDRARECLASAQDESRAGRFAFAVNRCYCAAFYAASATLLARGRRFVKHSGVRAAVHRDLVKAGLLSAELGKLYDRLFHDRQQGDYVEFVSFDAEEAARTIVDSSALVRALESLMASRGAPD